MILKIFVVEHKIIKIFKINVEPMERYTWNIL